MAAIRAAPVPSRSLENRSHGHSGRLGAGLAESEAVASTVTHELDPGRGRSTPGFGLPVKELDILVGGGSRHRSSVCYPSAFGGANPVCGLLRTPGSARPPRLSDMLIHRHPILWEGKC